MSEPAGKEKEGERKGEGREPVGPDRPLRLHAPCAHTHTLTCLPKKGRGLFSFVGVLGCVLDRMGLLSDCSRPVLGCSWVLCFKGLGETRGPAGVLGRQYPFLTSVYCVSQSRGRAHQKAWRLLGLRVAWCGREGR